MILSIVRFSIQPRRTIGELFIDGGNHFCYTLEDAVRPSKIYGKTAIPAGNYLLNLRNSPKFGPSTLWFMNVPNFEYIYIHAGNTEADTLGCILVGQTLMDLDTNSPGPEAIGRSRAALDTLRSKVVPVLQRGEEVWIEIA